VSERNQLTDDAQIAALRRDGAEGRLRIAMNLSNADREIAIAAIRNQHPEYTPREVIEALVWQIHKIRLSEPEPE
jgi:hypothetical protein